MRVQELQKLLLSLAVMDDMEIKPLVAETGKNKDVVDQLTQQTNRFVY